MAMMIKIKRAKGAVSIQPLRPNSWMCEVSAGFLSDTKATTGYRTGDLNHKTLFLVAAVLQSFSRDMVGPFPMAEEIPKFTSKEEFCIAL